MWYVRSGRPTAVLDCSEILFQ